MSSIETSSPGWTTKSTATSTRAVTAMDPTEVLKSWTCEQAVRQRVVHGDPGARRAERVAGVAAKRRRQAEIGRGGFRRADEAVAKARRA